MNVLDKILSGEGIFITNRAEAWEVVAQLWELPAANIQDLRDSNLYITAYGLCHTLEMLCSNHKILSYGLAVEMTKQLYKVIHIHNGIMFMYPPGQFRFERAAIARMLAKDEIDNAQAYWKETRTGPVF